MARITVETSKRSFLSRIVFLIVGLAIIFLCLKGLALQFFGKTTSATITNVTFNEEANSDRDYFITKADVSYSYSVDGMEYSGYAMFSVSSNDSYTQTGVKLLTGYDSKFREEWKNRKALQIKYLPVYPKISDAAENTKNSFWGTFLRVAGIPLGLLFIILAVKPNKKQNAVNTFAQPTVQNVPYANAMTPPGYTPAQQQYAPAPQQPTQAYASAQRQYTPAQQQPAQAYAPTGDPPPPQQTKKPNFCPSCGAAVRDEGNFCANCGNKLI